MASEKSETKCTAPSSSESDTPKISPQKDWQPPPSSAIPDHPNVASPSAGTDAPQYPLEVFNPISPHTLSHQRTRERFTIQNNVKVEKDVVQYKRRKSRKLHSPPQLLDWSKQTHPEGQVYFWHAPLRTYTLTWMFDENLADFVDKAANALRQIVDAKIMKEDIPENMRPPRDTDIVLVVSHDDNDVFFHYYLASRTERQVFWLNDVPMDFISHWEVPVYDDSHLESAEEALYWLHVSMFPLSDKTLPEDTWSEDWVRARRLLTYNATDAVMSITSTSPFTSERARQLTTVLKDMEVWKSTRYSIFVLASTMYLLTWARFSDYYGQQNARLNRDQSVFQNKTTSRSWWFHLSSIVLFYWPQVYVEKIEGMWVDRIVNLNTWNNFFEGLQKDWKNCITPATVVLSANVGLLAIQSVDNPPASPARSAAQIASYVSTLLSMGNIITCTILSRQHRMHSRSRDATDAADFLARRAGTKARVEFLAVCFSIPSGLFVWGILAFLVAVTFICFHHTSAVTQATVAVLFGLGAIPTLYLSIAEWDLNPPQFLGRFPSFQDQVKLLMRRFAPRKQAQPGSAAPSVSAV